MVPKLIFPRSSPPNANAILETSMRTIRLLIACVCSLSPMLVSQRVSAQGFLERMGRQLGDRIGEEIQQSQQRQTPQSGTPGQPTRGFSIPSESGQENTGGGSFRDRGFFGPGTTPPRVIQPTPRRVTRPEVETVYPQQGVGERTYSTPQPTTPSVSRTVQTPPSRSTAVSNREFKIRAPRSFERSVGYRLVSPTSEYPFTIRPGEAQTLVESKVWLIRYYRGSEQVTYRLRGGKLYEFGVDQQGQVQLYEEDDTFAEPPRRPGSRGR